MTPVVPQPCRICDRETTSYSRDSLGHAFCGPRYHCTGRVIAICDSPRAKDWAKEQLPVEPEDFVLVVARTEEGREAALVNARRAQPDAILRVKSVGQWRRVYG